MIRGRVVERLAVETDRSPATDAHESPDQMPIPTLDERANFYLRAVYGDRDFTNEEYSRARNLLLGAMAADIVERSSIYLAKDASLPSPCPTGEEHEHPTTIADASLVIAALELDSGATSVSRSATRFDFGERGSQGLPHRGLAYLLAVGRLPKHVAAACAAVAFAAVVGVWVAGIFPTGRVASNTPSDDSHVAARASPPEPSDQMPAALEPRSMAAAQREVASALNAARLGRDDVAALLKHGQELIAEGKFRGARLVLARAAEAGSAPAALALGGTYDPLIREVSDARPDAPPDTAMARAWYEKAKELGSAEAARRLGQLPAAVPALTPRANPK